MVLISIHNIIRISELILEVWWQAILKKAFAGRLL